MTPVSRYADIGLMDKELKKEGLFIAEKLKGNSMVTWTELNCFEQKLPFLTKAVNEEK